jgi:type II secretory pathway pseudopilin PulG
MAIRWIIRGERGFGLIELLVLIVVTGILVSIAMQSMDVAIEDARRVRTEREMEALARAIVGDPSIASSGARSDLGYVGDVGAFPPDLNALYRNPGAYATWAGPYLPPGYIQDSIGYKTDEWGQLYGYSGGITITSVGGGATITKKLADAASDYLLNSTRGLIKDINDSVPRSAYMDSVDIELSIPDGMGSMSTIAGNPDAAGSFAFDSLPVGRHALRIIYTPEADTILRYLTILPRHKSNPPPEYFFATAHFSAPAGGGCSGGGSVTLRPMGPGSTTNLAADGCAANWQCVDEAVADDNSSYVESAGTTYASDTYETGNPADTSCTIASVSVWARARRFVKDAYARVALRTYGSDYEGSEEALSDSYVDYSSQWTLNPATGAAWTWSEINAFQIGVSLRSVKATHPARCTQVWVVVDYMN